MKEKLISILRSKHSLTPSALGLKLALRSMPTKEKTVLLILILIFLIGGLGILVGLQKKYAEVVAVEGGVINEGIVGTPHLVNPLLASTDADRDLVTLIYASLMKPNGSGGLEKELAENYSISDDGLSYTFKLKEKLYWHDGKPITSEDIAFTINTAKNPMIKSPIRANWEGVEIEIVDSETLRFLLKRPYAPFLENTTLGILPKHLWKNATAEQFGLSEFNRQPVGAGPYTIKNTKRNSAGIITAYELKSFNKYALGKPLIPTIKMFFYNSESEMLADYETGRIDSLSSISAENISKISRVDGSLKALNLPRIFGIFFNQNKSEILLSQNVRRALDESIDKEMLVKNVLSGFGTALASPFPPGIMGFEKRESVFNPEEARDILENDGWKLNEETGIREKQEKGGAIRELQISISTSNNSELIKTAEFIKTTWQDLGVKTELRIYEIGDLNQIVIRPRDYETLLFGQVVGRDPDPFAFWHSSQRNDPGLNIALYANKTVDGILESARSTNNIEERREKYAEFEEEIIKDIPAIFLYSPYYLYVPAKDLKGFDAEMIVIPAERMANVHRWHLYTTRVWKIFIR